MKGEACHFYSILEPIRDGDKLYGMLGVNVDITDRKRAEKELAQSKALLEAAIENLPFDFFAIGPDGRYILQNDTSKQHWGNVIGKFPKDVCSNSVELALWLDNNRRAFNGEKVEGEVELTTHGETRFFHNVLSPIRSGRYTHGILGINIDITDRKRAEQEKLEMERRLLHAQKLESLGILAGGIAHDFNNILAGIMGYADLVKVQLPESEPARKDIDIIKKAVERAAHLTRQMLAYSGKGKFIVEPVSLSRVVKDMRAMLEMSISKKATLNCNLASDLPMIEADASQIHQIILNLVINASEALGEDSGVIAISTDTIHCSGTDCAVLGGDDLREGLYVRLEVTDTGCGMDEANAGEDIRSFLHDEVHGPGIGLGSGPRHFARA